MAVDLELEQEESDSQKGKYLTFSLGQESYGIEINCVREIIGIQPITAIPDVADYVKGIINLRGIVIPVIDVRLKFRKEACAYNDRTCIIVIEIKGVSLGLIVDQVAEVMDIPEKNIVPPPDSRTGFHNHYIKGIGKAGDDVKLLLDGETLLSGEEIESLEAAC